MNLIIFGPPGAGKGTQSKFIAENFKLFQLSTGEFLRKEIATNTDIGKKISSIINAGSLVSDIIVSDLIEKIISNEKYHNRIIFDGYPRSLGQAKNLDLLLKKYHQKIDIVLKLSVSLETVKKRVYERRSVEWVLNIMLNPDQMLKEDPIAIALLKEYNNILMLNQNLSENEAKSLAEYFRTL